MVGDEWMRLELEQMVHNEELEENVILYGN